MAKEWRNPRRQRLVLQLALCLLLAAVLGLAHLASRARLRMNRVALARPQTFGSITAAIPADWTHRTLPNGLIAQEGSATSPHPQRTLTILHERSAEMLHPVEYLQRAGHLPANAGLPSEPFAIAGWPGVLLRDHPAARDRGPVSRTVRRLMIAAAVLPSRDVLLVHLEGPGAPEPADEHLLRRVAASLAVRTAGQPAAAPASLELPGGIRLSVPGAWVRRAEPDPYRNNVQLLAASTDWLALDLVPCVFLPGDPTEAIGAMMVLRDPSLRPAMVQKLSAATCRVRQRGPESETWPVCLYLLANPDGQALLAEFRSGARSTARMDSLWQAIAPTVRFPATAPVRQQLERGAQAVQQLAIDQESPLRAGRPPEAESWLWYDDSPAPQRRFSRIRYTLDDGRLNALRTTQLPAIGDDAAENLVQRWSASADLAEYRYAATRPASPAPVVQQTRLERSEVESSIHQGAKLIDLWTGPAPAQFVPGGLLPLVLGRLPQQPMLLRTESCWGWERSMPAGLVTLLVEPSFDLPRSGESGPEPLRSFSVTINGTGQVTRWYLREDGAVQYIDFPAGLHLQRQQDRPPGPLRP